ncbi:MAG: hypothetical protein Q8P90_06215 [bacterium]|nr:hypothetical protein [bacterium]
MAKEPIPSKDHRKPDTADVKSPILESIIDGDAIITPASEGGFVQSRTINGTEWTGTSHGFEIRVPKKQLPKKNGQLI